MMKKRVKCQVRLLVGMLALSFAVAEALFQVKVRMQPVEYSALCQLRCHWQSDGETNHPVENGWGKPSFSIEELERMRMQWLAPSGLVALVKGRFAAPSTELGLGKVGIEIRAQAPCVLVRTQSQSRLTAIEGASAIADGIVASSIAEGARRHRQAVLQKRAILEKYMRYEAKLEQRGEGNRQHSGAVSPELEGKLERTRRAIVGIRAELEGLEDPSCVFPALEKIGREVAIVESQHLERLWPYAVSIGGFLMAWLALLVWTECVVGGSLK